MTNFIHQRRVAFAETDMAGIMHFANYYRFMEEAEHAFFRSLDLEIMHTLKDDHSDVPQKGNSESGSDGSSVSAIIGWPRVSCQCSYEAPIHYNDIIDLRVSIQRIGAKSLTFSVEFWREDERVARGKMKTACCLCKPNGKLESILIPDDYRKKLSPWEQTS